MFATQEEADAAYKEHLFRKQSVERLRSAGYPKRHIENLSKMHGPGYFKAHALWPTIRDGGTVFLIGDRGPGKTQITTFFAEQMLRANRSCGRYVTAVELFSALKSTWGSESKQSETEVLKAYQKAAFLVIDEAQERGDTANDKAWSEKVFTQICDYRYRQMLPTAACFNYTLERFEADVPASIRSRLSECGGLAVCDWPSYRTQDQ